MRKEMGVCIPSYNVTQFVGETVKSVLNSFYQIFEVIINDDTSRDNTLNVIESFHDSRIGV
jgi:teichuronic acid biosynthesis glycosyltransferase TuaG